MGKHLVVRCSRLDGVNPIEEVDHVARKHGYCWFGKYGLHVGRLVQYEKRETIRVILTGGSSVIAAGVGKRYDLKTWSYAKPDTSVYPRYYKHTLERISTWLCLVPTNEPYVATERFIVLSSAMPLPHVLNASMRGHMWCIEKASGTVK